MSEGLVWLQRLAQIAFAFALLGGSFALWSRSKGAAACGAIAGALLVFFEIVNVVMDAVFRSSGTSPVTTRMIYSLTFGFGTILHYLLLITMVVLVTKKKGTV